MLIKSAVVTISALAVAAVASQTLPWWDVQAEQAIEPMAASADEIYDPSNVIIAHSEQVSTDVQIGGTVVPVRKVTLTAQIPGSIRYIAGKAGMSVRANNVLVAVNREQILAQRNAAIAQFQRAQAELANAEMQHRRQMYLTRNGRSNNDMGGFMPFGMDRMMNGAMGGGPSKAERRAEVFDSRTSITKAHNAITAARSRIEEIDAAIADSDSRAPFDGVIFEKLVEVGDTVQPGQALLVLADLSRLQVETDIPASLVRSLRRGSALELRLESVDEPIMARVAQVFPMADRVRHTVRVKIDLPPGVPATAGMYAEVSVPGDEMVARESYPVVPEGALTYRGGLPMVQVLGKDGDARLRLVRLGEKTESGIAVVSGLKDGERVLVDSVQYSAN